MNAKWTLAALGGLSLGLALPLQAADKATHQTMTELTADYNAQTTDVQNLRDKGWSWNEIGDALAVSKRADRPLQEVVAQRDSGMSWNQISERYGFKFSDVSGEARRVAKDARRADKNERQAIRHGAPRPVNPDTGPNPEGTELPQQAAPSQAVPPSQTNPPADNP